MIRENAMSAARRAKHVLSVSEKLPARHAHALLEAVSARVQPFRFDALRYPAHRFLRVDEAQTGVHPVPDQVFVVWTGDNEMPPVRRRNLEKILERVGMPVHLVTPRNLDEWILEDHPLHHAYPYLSLTHKSDYLRAYLLHHHGGGYSDIKAPAGSWRNQFELLQADGGVWLAGYPEDSKGRIPAYGGNLELDLHRHFRLVFGTGAMVMRPRTPLTAEWFKEMERRLDYVLPLVRRHPGGVRDEVADYPVGWTQLLADILYPLALKYAEHIRLDPAFTPPAQPYR